MTPSYEELVELNPLLKKRGAVQVAALVSEIESCGFKWDPNQKAFYSSEIDRHVRTQGLDMFGPGDFARSQEGIRQEMLENPRATHFRRLWAWGAPKAFWLIGLWFTFGWLLGWKRWFLVLLGQLVCFIIFAVACRSGWALKG